MELRAFPLANSVLIDDDGQQVDAPIFSGGDGPSVPSPPVGGECGVNSQEPRHDLLNTTFEDLGFTVYFVNARSVISAEKRVLLSADLEVRRPDIVGITETWLDESVESLDIPGYRQVSRRDREKTNSSGLNHGGIALYCRIGCILVTHLEDSRSAERSWHIIHTDIGGILLCLWYRPPGSDNANVTTFDDELSRLSAGTIGALIVGDMNIWHKSWLKHSPVDTVEGEKLHQICKEHALKQVVSDPTRGPNLLDLALSSVPAACSAEVLGKFSDHNAVFVRVDIPTPCIDVLERVVWDFTKAQWNNLISAYENFAWSTLLQNDDIDTIIAETSRTILDIARQHIPRKTIKERKGSHPWLDADCLHAIRRKRASDGTVLSEEATRTCTATIADAYTKYIEKKKAELRALKRGSKKWWLVAKSLLDSASKRGGIPSLRDENGEWVHDPVHKADMFADMLSKKFVLPAESHDDNFESHSDDDFVLKMSGFVFVRERWVLRELKRLRVDQATGPDDIPTRLLKDCASVLSRPFCAVLRKIVVRRTWPKMWQFHRIAPLFKKGAVHNVSNYRGLHLTCILSKVAERVLRIPLVSFFEAVGAYGDTQFAFRKNRGCHDLLLILLCAWLLAFQNREKVGIFLSDIAGAFDRVDSSKLVAKLRQLGVNDVFVDLLESYLRPRSAKVAVNGADSHEFELQNMLYQGTVLGPNLWNVFFADVHGPAEATGCKERKFADDLNAFKNFARNVSNDEILADLGLCQSSVHEWGGAKSRDL